MTPLNEGRQTFTVEEAAEILGIGRNSAYEAIRRGEIPALRLGRRLVVPRQALERLLRNSNSETAAVVHNSQPRSVVKQRVN